MQEPNIIAIDGGSGVGKSSSSSALASRLNYLYVDTGTHYRAVTLLLQKAKVPYTDAAAVAHHLAHWVIDEEVEKNVAHITINHQRLADTDLRTASVNTDVSYYAALPVVRQYLLHFQRSQSEVAVLAGLAGAVIEGRDIGLNIFPGAKFKYFLVADPAVKAARRAKEGLLDVVDHRDHIDATQGQLRKAPNAVEVDTTHRSLEQVVDWLYNDITLRLKA